MRKHEIDEKLNLKDLEEAIKTVATLRLELK